MANNDRISEVYEGTLGTAEARDRARERVHWMCSRVSGARVLDIGCSQGIASILLGREGKTVTGLDRERAALEFARARLVDEPYRVQKRVEFVYGEATS